MTSKQKERDFWKNYFSDAANFRVALQRNIYDNKFASNKRGQIVYVFDANVVTIFSNPQENTNLISPFLSLNKSHDLTATTIITAEFLFSRKLAGQNGIPAFITPSHYEDLIGMMVKVQEKFRKGIESLNNSENNSHPDGQQHRWKIIQSIDRKEIDLMEGLAQLCKKLPTIVRNVLFAPTTNEATHFLRLYKEDLLRPLEINTAVTRDILEPDEILVNEWIDRLKSQRQNQNSTHDQEKIKRDAISLVQVNLLNESAQNNWPPTRYVLVTADQTIQRAYSIWFWEEQIKSDFILRHPSQYVPILNSKELPNKIHDSELIRHAQEVLDTLLSNVKEVHPAYPRILSYYTSLLRTKELDSLSKEGRYYYNRLKNLYSEPPKEWLLTDLNNKWIETFSNTVMLNTEYLRQREEAAFAPIVKFINSGEDIHSALLKHQSKILDDLEFTHVKLNLRSNLLEMVKENPLPADKPSRAPIAIRSTFKEFTNNRPFNEFLEEFATKQDKKFLETLDNVLKSNSNDLYRTMFFSACIAFRCGRWEAANHYSRRSLDFIEQYPDDKDRNIKAQKSVDLYEIYYILALSRRFTFKDDKETFKNTTDLLDKAANHHSENKDSFGLMRAISEKAALYLVWDYVHAWKQIDGKSTPLNSITVEYPIREVKELLHEARELIPQSLDKASEPLYEVIATQIHNNIISAAIFSRHLTNDLEIFSINEIQSALSEMEHRFTSKPQFYPPILETESKFMRWSIESDETKRDVLASQIRETCRDLFSQEQSRLAEFDKDQLKIYLKIL